MWSLGYIGGLGFESACEGCGVYGTQGIWLLNLGAKGVDFGVYSEV